MMYEDLEQKIVEAEARLAALLAEQEPAREALRVALAELNAVALPLQVDVKARRDNLKDWSRRTIGPWVVEDSRRWKGASLRVSCTSEPEAWYNRRVWLRVVTGERETDTRWQADIQHINGSGMQQLVLGPPTDKPDDDFEAHCRTVKKRCEEIGYVVVPDPPLAARIFSNALEKRVGAG